jgi:PST family polysaccharide transporter
MRKNVGGSGSLDISGAGAAADPARTPADASAMSDRDDGLRTATVKGTAWSYVSFITMRLPALVTIVVLTRLIAPSDFGIIAIGLVVLTYLDTLNEFGINAAVIYFAHDDERELSVSFWLSMASGVVAALVMSIAAFPLAALFDEPQLRSVIPALSLAYVLSSLGSVHIALLKKRLQFRQLVPVDAARAIGKAVVAIGGAFAGWGVWSLVAGQLAGELAGSVVVWIRLKWRPAFDWDWTIVRRVLGYGSHIMGVGVTGVILTDLDYLIVGSRLGTEQLGFYSVGFRLPELAVMGVCYAVSATMFPVLTKLRDDSGAVESGLAKSLRVLALVTIPIGVGIALTSKDFVATFYGAEWAPTAEVMPLIALYSVVVSITFVCGDAYKAMGRPGILATMGAARIPLALICLLLVVSHGIVWVAATQLTLITISMIAQMIVAHHVLDLPFGMFIRSTRSGVLASAAMAVVVIAFQQATSSLSSPARLFVAVAIGVVTYGAVALALERSLIGEVAHGLRTRVGAAA